MNNQQSGKEAILSTANNLRWEVGENFHDTLMESIYLNASDITKRAVASALQDVQRAMAATKPVRS